MARFNESGGSIGRSADNDLVLPDPERHVSKKHAIIVFQSGGYFLTDTSKNGTYFVNKCEWLRKSNFKLHDRERFQIGDYEIQVFIKQRKIVIKGEHASYRTVSKEKREIGYSYRCSHVAHKRSAAHEFISEKARADHKGSLAAHERDAAHEFSSEKARVVGDKSCQLDEVHLTVSAPRFIKPESSFVARFAAYIQEREAEVRRKIEIADRGHSEFIPQPETCRWQQGAPIRVRIIGDCFTAVPAEHTFEWNGSEAIKSFQVRPKSDVSVGSAQLGFEILVADFPEAWLWVEIEISNDLKPSEKVGSTGQPMRRAFASYASADLSDVLTRISAIAAWDKGLDIFYSWLDLIEGEDWEDRLKKELSLREVLLLFWSRNAKASKWVEWEWQTVLRTKGVRAIQPVPIEPPEIAIPPEELAPYINFRDRYLVAREAALRIAELKAGPLDRIQ